MEELSRIREQPVSLEAPLPVAQFSSAAIDSPEARVAELVDATDLDDLSARAETLGVRLPKFGERFRPPPVVDANPEPSRIHLEGVETRRAAPNAARPW